MVNARKEMSRRVGNQACYMYVLNENRIDMKFINGIC